MLLVSLALHQHPLQLAAVLVVLVIASTAEITVKLLLTALIAS